MNLADLGDSFLVLKGLVHRIPTSDIGPPFTARCTRAARVQRSALLALAPADLPVCFYCTRAARLVILNWAQMRGQWKYMRESGVQDDRAPSPRRQEDYSVFEPLADLLSSSATW